MDGRVSTHCRRLCCNCSQFILFSLAPFAWCGDLSETTNNSANYSTSFSRDIASINPFNHQRLKDDSNQGAVPDLELRSQQEISQKQVSSFVYKTVNDPKKIVKQAAAAAAIVGLEALGAARPLKESMQFIKKKTQFKFGDCGKVQFSSKLKAESCLMDNSKIELNSDYKLDSVTINFKWSL